MESAYLSDPSSLYKWPLLSVLTTHCTSLGSGKQLLAPFCLQSRIALVRELCVVVAGCVPHHWTRPIELSQ